MSAMIAALMLAQAAGLPAAPVWRKDAPVPPPSSMEAPDAAAASSATDKRVTRSPDGHFYVNGLVNGVGVRFVVDTGAGAVMLTPYDAQRIGLKVDAADFRQRAITPAGVTYVAPVSLGLISVGGRQVRNVPAVVTSANSGVSLLGMSFLKHMQRVTIENGVLKLE